MQRRGFLAGSAAALLPTPSLSAASADRTFRILRDGDDIGTHILTAMTTSRGFEIEITIRIAVNFLGITAYRYEMDNREVWQGGQLVQLDSTVNDDGTTDFARIRRDGEKLMVEGSGYTGEVPTDAVTTTYYTKEFIKRRPWLSTQSGLPLSIEITPDGADAFRVAGQLETRLEYDDRGEWVSCQFDAGGEPARYEIADESGRIAELWASA